MLSLSARKRLGSDSGQLVVKIGFVPCPETNAKAFELLGGCAQTLFVSDSAETEMRMLNLWVVVVMGGFEDGVRRLNRLLRE